ncbi:MAG TPA: hypothetical protein VGL51_01755 [Solirubrobacteraceae bacterium]
MADDTFKSLRAQLGDDLPDGVRRLNSEQLDDLAQAVAETRHRQRAELAAAGDRALGMIPRLLRGPIRRIVG